MTNAERIAALRRCSYTTVAGADREDGYCKPCAYFAEDTSDITCIDRMMIDAADALEAAEAALNKQIPKKAVGTHYAKMRCPSCGKRISSGGGSSSRRRDNWCNYCGQKIDWGEHDE